MDDTKYDEETLDAMVGTHGGKPPTLTLNCTTPGRPMGRKTGIGGGFYVGINFGEQWNDQAFEAVKLHLNSKRTHVKSKKMPVLMRNKDEDTDENNS